MKRHLAASAVIALALSAPARARAQPTPAAPVAVQPSPEVEAEHARGIELRRQQRDADARDVFRAIYERTREPRALARQAAAEAAMGEWVAAEEHLAAALTEAADPWITQNRAGLESDLAGFRAHVGLLDVASSTPGAEVWIGGARVAALPLERPLRVRAGTFAVEVRAEGYLAEVRPVTVPPGLRATARETVNLTPAVARPAVLALPVVPAPPPPREAPPARSPVTRVVGLTLLGAGLAGVGVGVYGMARYAGDVSAFNGDPTCGSAALTPACRAVYDSGVTARTIGAVGLAAGGAVAAGGLTLLLLSLRVAPRAPAVSVAVSPAGVDVRVGASF